MRTLLILIFIACSWVAYGQQSVSAPLTNWFGIYATNADVIAIVTVGAAVEGPVPLRATDAELVRTIKGSPPAKFQIRESNQPGSIFPLEQVTRSASGIMHSGTSRWLVFLKKTGDSFTAVSAQSLCSVYGTGPGSRVIFRGSCLSIEEVEERINKFRAQK